MGLKMATIFPKLPSSESLSWLVEEDISSEPSSPPLVAMAARVQDASQGFFPQSSQRKNLNPANLVFLTGGITSGLPARSGIPMTTSRNLPPLAPSLPRPPLSRLAPPSRYFPDGGEDLSSNQSFPVRLVQFTANSIAAVAGCSSNESDASLHPSDPSTVPPPFANQRLSSITAPTAPSSHLRGVHFPTLPSRTPAPPPFLRSSSGREAPHPDRSMLPPGQVLMPLFERKHP